MKLVHWALMMLLTQSAQAGPNQEAVIRLQVASIDASVADTVRQNQSMGVDERQWVEQMDKALVKQMTGNKALFERLHTQRLRRELLRTIYYEAKRAGLEPDLVLSVIRGESNFRKYAISSAGARGYMQVMPFWANIVGERSTDLFNVRTNLRLGCAILRAYLDQEKGDLSRALARYNGSADDSTYSNYIYASWVN
ncbi:transglycosylase SLT domain-containing protein [Methylomonas sp. MO1]|uniref:lytic transglycosylase domain-containing protein n=1 Tax=Methylomonas sp. MO1 TaxID=3073619 RepID=UPI0028A33904|nr:transglycosylase SLT domain-containing protein [Methylomonas sp. MO1]MDT4292356.1 transglycosylase SLT domain-containing protein [Methylomonas sp. MO1]